MATLLGMEDPIAQEKIRRGSHEYVPTAGKHGSYEPKPYFHQEYPKMMEKLPAPLRKDFKSDVEFDQAKIDWDRQMMLSIVHSKTEEDAWLAKHEAAEAKTEKEGKKTRATA